MLIREAGALDESAQQQLEMLYEHGVPGGLAAYDARILAWFQTAIRRRREGGITPPIGSSAPILNRPARGVRGRLRRRRSRARGRPACRLGR